MRKRRADLGWLDSNQRVQESKSLNVCFNEVYLSFFKTVTSPKNLDFPRVDGAKALLA